MYFCNPVGKIYAIFRKRRNSYFKLAFFRFNTILSKSFILLVVRIKECLVKGKHISIVSTMHENVRPNVKDQGEIVFTEYMATSS